MISPHDQYMQLKLVDSKESVTRTLSRTHVHAIIASEKQLEHTYVCKNNNTQFSFNFPHQDAMKIIRVLQECTNKLVNDKNGVH